MPLTINSNAAATMAANNLAASNQLLQRSLNRLSSGSKIVNPSDDAGGLAVSMKLSAAANRQRAASVNLGNSVSYLQTQDGALKVAGKILERIGELKTLASDPTKNASDIGNYNAEFAALQSELSSLNNEKFNGISLFGSSNMSVSTDEAGGGAVSFGGVALLNAGSFAALNESFADLSNWTDLSTGGTAAASGGALTYDSSGGAVNVQSNQTFSGPMTIEFDTTGRMDLYLGSDILGTFVSGGTDHLKFVLDGTGGYEAFMNGSSLGTYSVSTTSGKISFQAPGATGTGAVSNLSVTSNGASNTGTVATASNLASLGLSTISDAIQDVATHRAANGAQQSRMEFASELLDVNQANLEAANSRITDVDVAQESTQLARYNILVQAGTSMLSQANQSAQNILRLLS